MQGYLLLCNPEDPQGDGRRKLMNFERLLLQAKEGNADAVLKILEIYKPLLIKNAIVNGRFDEDLYQELVSTLLQCIQRFQIIE